MKILLPLDGSRIAERVLDALPALARVDTPRIRLVSVLQAVEGLSEVAGNERLAREHSLLRGYLDSVVLRLKGVYGDGAVDSVLVAGDPVDEIVSQEASFGPDVLVIGTHGRSGIGRWRLGSVADAVIRRSQSDTLVVGPHAQLREPVRGILVGLDGSDLAERALQPAVKLAGAFNAAIHIVRVIPMTMTISETYYPTEYDMLEDFTGDYLNEVQKQLNFKGELLTASRIGSPAGCLLDYAAAHEIGLVVMTSHGRGGLERSLLGSVAGRMVGGPTPVWLVKSYEEG